MRYVELTKFSSLLLLYLYHIFNNIEVIKYSNPKERFLLLFGAHKIGSKTFDQDVT